MKFYKVFFVCCALISLGASSLAARKWCRTHANERIRVNKEDFHFANISSSDTCEKFGLRPSAYWKEKHVVIDRTGKIIDIVRARSKNPIIPK